MSLHPTALPALLALAFLAASVSDAGAANPRSVYDFKARANGGKDVPLSQYKGKVLLIVNTAARCGVTPQYADLEAV